MKEKALSVLVVFLWLSFLAFPMSFLFAQEKNYSPSSSCKPCHDQNYWGIASSMHSKGIHKTNILFQKIFDLVIEETDGQIREKCLSCHSPIAVEINDLKLKKDISKEGINCDYCHTLKSVKEEGLVKLVSSPGDIKYGPYKDSQTEAHKCEFSEVHTKSEICLKCHASLKNPHGLEVCSTAPEWEGSIFAVKNKQCQHCHMPTFAGKAAIEGPERKEVHLHNFHGGHDAGALSRAAKMELRMEQEEAARKLIVAVSNIGAGHNLPTASPLRSIAIKIFVYDPSGKELWTNWKKDPFIEDRQALFAKILTDDNGKLVLPLNATKVAFDSRLAPQETREFSYSFPQDLNIARITANLQYKYAPDSILDKLKIDDIKLRSWHTMTRAELSLMEASGDSGKGQEIASVIRNINLYAENWKFTPSEIKIKQGERVKLTIRTLDDTHGFRVKKMGINVKIFPGKPTIVEIEGKEKGKYKFDCSVPCGDRCFKMKGYIIVE